MSVRFEGDQVERLDRLAEALSDKVAGVKLNRSDATRAVIQRGIQVLEAELQLAPGVE